MSVYVRVTIDTEWFPHPHAPEFLCPHRRGQHYYYGWWTYFMRELAGGEVQGRAVVGDHRQKAARPRHKKRFCCIALK